MCAILVEQGDCVIGFYSVRYATTTIVHWGDVDMLDYSTTIGQHILQKVFFYQVIKIKNIVLHELRVP